MDNTFQAWFEESNQISQRLINEDINLLPRRRSVCIPFLDHMCKELDDRFKNKEMAQDGLLLVPANIIKEATGNKELPSGIEGLATLWASDLPDSDIKAIEAEYNRWAAKWHRLSNKGSHVPTTALESLEHCNKEFYPKLSILLRLLCTLPITTAECERTISRLRTLKTYLRSTMGEEQLTGLAVMRIH